MPENRADYPDYPAPDGLSDRSRALWCEVVPYRAMSAGRIALIEEALRALDRADQMREAVDRDGPTSTNKTTGMIHVHPCCKLEREARQAFTRIWTTLGLGWSSKEDGQIEYTLKKRAEAAE